MVLLSDLILFTARHIQISWSNSLNKHRMHRTFISLRRPSMLEHDLGENSVYGSFPHNDELVLQRESFHWYIFSCLRSRVFPSAFCDERWLLSHMMSCLYLCTTCVIVHQREFQAPAYPNTLTISTSLRLLSGNLKIFDQVMEYTDLNCIST